MHRHLSVFTPGPVLLRLETIPRAPKPPPAKARWVTGFHHADFFGGGKGKNRAINMLKNLFHMGAGHEALIFRTTNSVCEPPDVGCYIF